MIDKISTSPVIAGASAQLAGIIWILQWSHALVAHGPTASNMKRMWLGMTWFDSGKFLALAFLLLIPGAQFVRRRAIGIRSASILGSVVIGVLTAAAVGTALELWPYRWGSYDYGHPAMSRIIGPFASLLRGFALPLAWLSFGSVAVRARAIPAWLVALLVVTSFTTFFVAGPIPPFAGVAWLVFGAWLLRRTHGS